MAYGRLLGSAAGLALKASPVGSALGLARGGLRALGLGGLLGGMSASEKRLRSRARLNKLLSKAQAGTLSARGLSRLERKARGPYAKQAALAQAALKKIQGNRLQSSGGRSPSVGAGPMSLAFARATPRRRKPKSERYTKSGYTRGAVRAIRKARRAQRKSRMPPALARYWRDRRAKHRAARTLARD